MKDGEILTPEEEDKNANVVRDKPGARPNALSDFRAKLAALLNNRTPTTTTPKIV